MTSEAQTPLERVWNEAMNETPTARCPESAAVVYISEADFRAISDELRGSCQCQECFPEQLCEALTLIRIKVEQP